MKLAVIDIGTNSIHMLMAKVGNHFSFQVLGREKEMVRLGDQTLSKGMLSEAVRERGLKTLKQFVSLAQKKEMDQILAVATSAVRESQNGGDFIEEIQNQTGVRVQIITGEEEGRLIYLGVKYSQSLPKKRNTLIIDVGGGSVEVILGDHEKIHWIRSFKMGVVRLKELFGSKNSINLDLIKKYVQAQMAEISPLLAKQNFGLVLGTSGTLNNLEAMIRFRRAKSEKKERSFTPKEVKSLIQVLAKSSPSERAKMKGLDEKRQDLILGGATLVAAMMKEMKVDKITICDQAIREGMIYDFIEKNQQKLKLESEVPDTRLRQILSIMNQYNIPQSHAEQSAKIALQIFDQTTALHRLGKKDRDLLKYTALIHDIGYHISYERHHHHAYYLIKNLALSSFNPEEINIMALSARYHRGGLPKKNHESFFSLDNSLKKRILWIAAILRLADALDRTHFSVIESVKVKVNPKTIELKISVQGDAQYEIWEAEKKSDLLQSLAKRKIGFKIL